MAFRIFTSIIRLSVNISDKDLSQQTCRFTTFKYGTILIIIQVLKFFRLQNSRKNCMDTYRTERLLLMNMRFVSQYIHLDLRE